MHSRPQHRALEAVLVSSVSQGLFVAIYQRSELLWDRKWARQGAARLVFAHRALSAVHDRKPLDQFIHSGYQAIRRATACSGWQLW